MAYRHGDYGRKNILLLKQAKGMRIGSRNSKRKGGKIILRITGKIHLRQIGCSVMHSKTAQSSTQKIFKV